MTFDPRKFDPNPKRLSRDEWFDWRDAQTFTPDEQDRIDDYDSGYNCFSDYPLPSDHEVAQAKKWRSRPQEVVIPPPLNPICDQAGKRFFQRSYSRL